MTKHHAILVVRGLLRTCCQLPDHVGNLNRILLALRGALSLVGAAFLGSCAQLTGREAKSRTESATEMSIAGKTDLEGYCTDTEMLQRRGHQQPSTAQQASFPDVARDAIMVFEQTIDLPDYASTSAILANR